MNEAFLWYLWKYRLYHSKGLKTTDGEAVSIEHPGYQNHDSGPDFFNARIRIGETVWAGNVEVHTKSSDWYRHEHQHDPAYDNIILHVVHESDRVIKRSDGQIIPVVELKNNFEISKWSNYQKLTNSPGWVPCARQIQEVDPILLQQWLDRVLVSRLEKKTERIANLLTQSKGDWSKCFYLLLAQNFGFKVNAVPFELLANSIPIKILTRHSNNIMQMEALLLGQAGFLNGDLNDEYPRNLQKEFSYLQQKYGLQPLERHLWKFGRLRPGNFPTIRLMQFAKLIQFGGHLISTLFEAAESNEVGLLFSVSASEYWNTHYLPDKLTEYKVKSLGKSSIENILINTIVPFLFFYGKSSGETLFTEKALRWLEGCTAEKNTIVNGWKKIGLTVQNAGQTQALIELKTSFCNDKKCLTCGIGIKVLNR